MTKTRSDIIEMAHRRIQVLSADEAVTADMEAFAGGVLDALFAELVSTDGMAFTWTLDTTPDAAFLPLSYLLAVEIGPHYNMPVEPRGRAYMRLSKFAFPNDVVDRRDTNEDGVISEAEEQAGKEALYY